MSDEIIVDDELFQHVPSEPVEPISAPLRSSGPSWSTIALLCVACLWIGMNFQGCKRDGGDDRDDAIVIDDKTNAVMILQDKSQAGQDALTPGQAEAINSIAIAEWCDSNGFEFRAFDVKDDLTKTEPIWQSLRQKSASPPALTASKDGRATTGKLPDGSKATITALETLK